MEIIPEELVLPIGSPTTVTVRFTAYNDLVPGSYEGTIKVERPPSP